MLQYEHAISEINKGSNYGDHMYVEHHTLFYEFSVLLSSSSLEGITWVCGNCNPFYQVEVIIEEVS